MKKYKQIVIYPIDHDWKWSVDYQGQTAQQLVKNHNSKLFVFPGHTPYFRFLKNGFVTPLFLKKNKPILHEEYQRTHFFPLERFSIIFKINRIISFAIFCIYLQLKQPKHIPVILWISHPRFSWMILPFKKIFSQRGIVVFDIIDYFSSSDISEEKFLRAGEKNLIMLSDVVVTQTNTLARHYKSQRTDIYKVSSGFQKNIFSKQTSFAPRNNTTPIVGYIGAINHRLDLPLLKAIALQNKNIHFEFVGPKIGVDYKEKPSVLEEIEDFFKLPNVNYTDAVPLEKLHKKMLSWDLGIIPYDTKIALNIFCQPNKLLEYFYCGLPVISTNIPEIKILSEEFKHISIAQTAEQWSTIISQKTEIKLSKKEKSEMRNFALKNNWVKKIEEIQEKIDLKSH